MEDSQAAKTGLVNVGDEILQVYVYITCMYVPYVSRYVHIMYICTCMHLCRCVCTYYVPMYMYMYVSM